MKKKSRQKKISRKTILALRKFSWWLAGLVLLGGLIYYVAHGIRGSAAFEQFPRSMAFASMDQSGAPQTDKYGLYGTYYVKPGDTVDMWVTVKNLSRNPAANVWYPDSELADEGEDYAHAHAVGIGTADDESPFWLDSSSFVVNGNRFAYYDGPAVYRGKYLTLAWRVKISTSAVLGSTYPLNTSLIREFDERGERVYTNGRNYPIDTIRWAFRISNTDLYNNPVKSVSGYSGKLVYEDISGGLTEKLMSYNLNTGQVQTLFQRNRADIYSPTIYAQLVNPEGLFSVVQKNQAGEYGYGDKWIVDLGGNAMNFAAGGGVATGLNFPPNEWWSSYWSKATASISWIVFEKYNSTGIDLYNGTTKTFESYAPRLAYSPWEGSQFNGYFKKVWDPDGSKIYMARCSATKREDCENGTAQLEFDQIAVQSTPIMIEPMWALNDENFRTVDFDVYNSVAVGATSGIKNKIPKPPSTLRYIDLNTGLGQTITKSNTAAYRVEKISQDGDWFMYTARYTTGSLNADKTPRDMTLAWVSRTGDIYQPILVAQDFTDIRAIGWSRDNQYLVYVEYSDCASQGCPGQIKIFDLQSRRASIPTLPNSSRPVAVV